MDIDDDGKKFVEDNEGLRLKAYQDGGGVWTIGYGHTGTEVKAGKVVTVKEAIRLLESDLVSAVLTVNRLVKVGLSQNQFDALVDFVFNVGKEQFASSTLLKKLNLGDYTGAAAEFEKWKFDNGKVVSGLLARRQKERAMFESKAPDHIDTVVTPPIPAVNPLSKTPYTINWLSDEINEILNIVEGFFHDSKSH